MATTIQDASIRTLLDEETIAARVAALAGEIEATYPDGDFIAVCVLKGSIPFFADLIRHFSRSVRCDYLGVSSYGGGTKSTGVVKFDADLTLDVSGENILVVEDIIDTGLTLRYLLDALETRGVASLRVAALLDKPDRREADVEADFVGFTIPDEFVVGYGLDYAQYYRGLPYVGVLEEVPDLPGD